MTQPVIGYRVCMEIAGKRRYSPLDDDHADERDGLTGDPSKAHMFKDLDDAAEDIEMFGSPEKVRIVAVHADGAEKMLPRPDLCRHCGRAQ